ncbi:uncharacterized protein L969DRAFT_94064 [Mixia osmundae IAM 14324]|uniref:CUE domain-containing protein n=1 Tax=Mixia osmundae (strain CBS 9802 / IAM 14324 / JCM 22182 / KY 12970) TaxID=764103 RepID=G7E8Z4_MIXOS|nr:uncharacterized protein L969DRAFT_94064 [Mixia osmundae IAM 14324]KEI40248.1 hypothetical protein L969DRAFT_94064 [Mixia osmundae IAM 14324]GAA99612.1 hypothetical protein E5Q_06313 [Mixia osmundae IAM 14324]
MISRELRQSLDLAVHHESSRLLDNLALLHSFDGADETNLATIKLISPSAALLASESALSSRALLALSVCYAYNSQAFDGLAREAMRSPKLTNELQVSVDQSLQYLKQSLAERASTLDGITVFATLLRLQAHSSDIAQLYALTPDYLPDVASLYDKLSVQDEQEEHAYRDAQLDLLEFTHLVLASARQHHSDDMAIRQSLDLISALLRHQRTRPRRNVPLIAQLELESHLSSVLSDRFVQENGDVDSRIEYLVITLKELASDQPDQLAKGHAHQQDNTDVILSQVKEILPDCDLDRARTLLSREPLASMTAEQAEMSLIDTLLAEPDPAPARQPISSSRALFDGDFDASQVRLGKQSAPVTLARDEIAMTENMKALTLARAQAAMEEEAALSDEDDLFADAPKRVPAYLSDDDEAAGHERDDSDEEQQQPSRAPSPPLANPITPRIARLLEQAYIADPTVFDRTSEVRRSKARQQLKDSIGVQADELLEGWRVMLERNPRKDRILGKHAYSAPDNAPPESNSATPAQAGTRGRGTSRGRGRGRGQTNGGKAAHERRRRGHDRKVANML